MYNIYYIADGEQHFIRSIVMRDVLDYVDDILTQGCEITGIINANDDN